MFGEQFYPTPKELINKMCNKINWNNVKKVLEPSAGKGDIVDYINNEFKRYDRREISCIEVDSNLRHILKSKEYPVIFNNFLEYSTLEKFDLIIMNPPFADGAKHLLKALNLMKNGGQIACLLNAETIRNPYTNERQDLVNRLEELDADIEYIKDGFIDAERRTNVETALIYIKIENKGLNLDSSLLFNDFKNDYMEMLKINESNQLTFYDTVKQIATSYDYEVKIGVKLIHEYLSASTLFKDEDDRDIFTLSILDEKFNKGRHDKAINTYIEATRYKYWKKLFNSEKFKDTFTSNIREEMYRKIQELKKFDVNEHNIETLTKELDSRVNVAIEETIFALFEELSYKHHWNKEYGKNIHYYNGWATNEAYKINKKVIIPLSAYSSWSMRYDPSWSVHSKLFDIEKVFDFLAKKDDFRINIGTALEHSKEIGKTKNIECQYFYVTFYKKGTCHITFKDEDLLLKFNIFGGRRKNWLPLDYGTKTYENMDIESQKAIDAFQGKENYKKVCDSKDYFLSTNQVLMIESR